MSALGATDFFSGAIALAVYTPITGRLYAPYVREYAAPHISPDHIKECIVPPVSITVASY